MSEERLFILQPREDYDKEIKVDGEKFKCFSKDEMDDLYPEGGFKIVGETKKNNKKEKIGIIKIGDTEFIVCKKDKHSSIFNKVVGYIQVGNDEFIQILKGRFLFLILFFGILLGIGILIWFLIRGLSGDNPPVTPTVTDPSPINPLPPKDSHQESIESSEKQTKDKDDEDESQKGGGKVSMIYTLKAKISLTTDVADIYFKNPDNSNQCVALELYVENGEESYLIGQSGLVEPGNALYIMDYKDENLLSEGEYDAHYKVIYYNPDTGERALVESVIDDVTIIVSE